MAVLLARANPLVAGVHVAPTDVLNTVVAAQPDGTRVILDPGVHRLATCTPKTGMEIVFSAGAVMNGSDLLTAWTLDTGKWRHSITQGTGNNGGTCRAGVLCGGPEDLFRDNVKLSPVVALGSVVSGTFYVDRALNRVWVSDDPTAHLMEWSRIARAINVTNPGVTITDAVIEKYAPGAQWEFGAVKGSGSGTGCIMNNPEVRYCHGVGIAMWTGWVVSNCHVHHNGQLGIAAQGDNGLLEGGEIAYNNVSDYEPNWEAGATKFVKATNFTVRGVWCHHNFGYGLWCDIDNYGTVYEDNLVEDNDKVGILHEVSWDAIIRNNIVRRCGLVAPLDGWIGGLGIAVSASPDVQVYGNIVEDCASGIGMIQQNRGVGVYGPRTGQAHLCQNISVHDNLTIDAGTGAGVHTYAGGVQDYFALGSIFTALGNSFTNNDYVGCTGGAFKWDNGDRTFATWQGTYSLDLTGSFSATAFAMVGTPTTASGLDASPTLAKPTGSASGDWLYVVVHSNGDTRIVTDNNGATPTTKIVANPGGTGGGGTLFTIFRRQLGGSEPATYTWTINNPERWTVIAWTVRASSPTQDWDIAPASGAASAETSTTPTCPGITTLADHAWAFAVAGTDGTANGTFTGGPAGWTLVATENLQQPLSVYYKEITPAGATGNQDFATTPSGSNFALKIFSIRMDV